jgi:hypothetical protein
VTFAEVLSTLAFSTADDHIGAVSVLDSHLAPDGAVGELSLVARVNSLCFTPGLGLSGGDLGSSLEELSGHGTVEAATFLLDNGLDNDGLWLRLDDDNGSGGGSQFTGAHVELEEIGLVLGVKSDSQKLGFASDNVLDVPFLSGLGSGASEERSPSRVGELQVEARRLGLSRSSLVERLVHPDFLDRSRDISSNTGADVLSTVTFSTGDIGVGAVGERGLEVTPDGSVGDLLLVARSELSHSAVRGDLGGSDLRSLRVELSSHRSVETSGLLGNNGLDDGNGRRSHGESTSTHVELEEISLSGGIVSDTEDLSALSDDVLDGPGLGLVVTNASPDERLSGSAEFQRESRGHGLLDVALVVGLVHSDGLEISINLLGLTCSDVVSVCALSTVGFHIGTVGESLLHVTPDGTVAGLLLVARSDFSETAVLGGLISLTDTGSGEVHATHGAIEATGLHDDNVDGLGWWGNVDDGDSSESTSAHMELEEVGLLEAIKSNTVELGSVSGNGLGVPFLDLLVSDGTEKSSPGVTELEVETGRLGFSDSTLVGRFVHPDFVEVTSDRFFVALTEVLSAGAFSRGGDKVGTVVSRVVDHLHVTPDGTVGGLGLVARLDADDSAPRLGTDGLDLGGLGVELTGHGAVEAAGGLGDNLLELARSVFTGGLGVEVEGEFVHASVNGDDQYGEFARAIVLGGLGVVVGGETVHASEDELARAIVSGSLSVEVGSIGLHTSEDSESARSIVLVSNSVKVNSSRLGASRNSRLGSETTSAHVERKEVSLVLSVESNTVKLGFSANNFGDVPFLGLVGSGGTEEGSPSRLSELQVESRRLRLSRSVLVVGFVHPDFLDTSFNISRYAFSTLRFILAFSTDDERVGAVVESKSKVTPDRTVADLLLVARGDGSEFTVSRGSLSLDNRSLGVEFTSSGSVEASSSLGNDDLSSNGGGSGKERSSTEVELEEIGLGLGVIGDTHKLGSASDDVQGVPLLGGVVSGGTENGSPSSGGELEVESTRDGLVSSTLVRGFVHPYFFEITFDLSSGARSEVLSTSTCSGGDSSSFTVSESQSDLTPDRAIGDILLVPGLDLSDLTVLVNSSSFSNRGTGEELSSHGGVEASTLLGIGDGSSDSGHDGSFGAANGLEASSTKVELKEVSLGLGVESSSIELSTTTFNLRSIPLSDGTVGLGSENLSPFVVEFKLETGRHHVSLSLFALVLGAVHPDLV